MYLEGSERIVLPNKERVKDYLTSRFASRQLVFPCPSYHKPDMKASQRIIRLPLRHPTMEAKRIIFHPAHFVESAAAFTHEVEVMRESELKRFVKHTREESEVTSAIPMAIPSAR